MLREDTRTNKPVIGKHLRVKIGSREVNVHVFMNSFHKKKTKQNKTKNKNAKGRVRLILNKNRKYVTSIIDSLFNNNDEMMVTIQFD